MGQLPVGALGVGLPAGPVRLPLVPATADEVAQLRADLAALGVAPLLMANGSGVSGGLLEGRVTVAGRDTRTHLPRHLADVVGVVGQDPATTFTTETVEDELAYTMEQLGIEPSVMRKRVEETLDVLGLARLRHRRLHNISSISTGSSGR